MTEPIYYQYPHHYRFKAIVQDCLPYVSKDYPEVKFAILLDRTLFYPQGGGQPGDRGVIESNTVTSEIYDTLKGDNGAILHLSNIEIAPTTEIEGTLDIPYRKDFQTQHTSQHLLSAIMYKEANANTIAVHFGNDTSTIEVDVAPFSDFQLSLFQEIANSKTEESINIHSKLISKNSFDLSTLRRQPKKDFTSLRVLEIDGYDLAPCGGVHATNTAQLAPIFITGQEKTPDGCKIEFIAGKRALSRFNSYHKTMHSLSSTLSSPIESINNELKNYFTNQIQLKENFSNASELLVSKLLENYLSSNSQTIDLCDLKNLSNPQIPIIANSIAKKLSDMQKSALILFLSEKGTRFILLDFKTEGLFEQLKAKHGKSLCGGGRAPRFEGTIIGIKIHNQ